MTTAQDLLNNKPSESEVARVDNLWAEFHTTTQFLEALKQVLINRDLPNEQFVLERFLPTIAKVEAEDMNGPLIPEPLPITQRLGYTQHDVYHQAIR